MARKKTPALTADQAQLLIDAFQVCLVDADEEETELLKKNNPELYEAMVVLLAIAAQ